MKKFSYKKCQFNKNMTKLMIMRNISDESMAHTTRMSTTTISDWQTGRVHAPQANVGLLRAAQKLGVTVDQLVFGKL